MEKNTHFLSSHRIRAFQAIVYRHFADFKRDLPWRKTQDPYRIYVSEIMLQQTGVERVAQKYQPFIRRFRSFKSLSQGPLKDIVLVWQGLGYNRRALMMHACAQEICADYGGQLPADPEVLKTLPGIGPNTAASIAAFAFNLPTAFIETNIRTVYIHHFFPSGRKVSDKEILALVDQTLDRKNPSLWYNALMDYGASLKKKHKNPSRRSAHYTKQSRFEGSDRQVRGKILKLLLEKSPLSAAAVRCGLGIDAPRCARILAALAEEGFLKKCSGGYRLC